MATEEYSIGYEAGYQNGWNEANRPFVGLTDEEIDSALGVYDSFGGRLDARKIEAKLKELNA